MISLSFLGSKDIMFCQSRVAYFVNELILRFKVGTPFQMLYLYFNSKRKPVTTSFRNL